MERERLKLLRQALNFTQAQMAEKLGIERATYTRYESGKRKMSNVIKKSLCREFHVNREWLETGEGIMINLTDHQLDVFMKFKQLTKAQQLEILEFIKNLIKNLPKSD